MSELPSFSPGLDVVVETWGYLPSIRVSAAPTVDIPDWSSSPLLYVREVPLVRWARSFEGSPEGNRKHSSVTSWKGRRQMTSSIEYDIVSADSHVLEPRGLFEPAGGCQIP